MKICVVGGGHIGTTLVCYIKHTYPNYQLSLLTRRPEKFFSTILCNDIEGGFSYEVTPDIISSNAKEAASGAEVIFIALPHFAVENAFRDISPYVYDNAMIGVLPGGGGCEFFFDKYFDKNKTLFGFQRVPFTAKVQDYGKVTNLKSWKPYSVVGALNRNRIDDVCEVIENCGLKTRKASNYLEIALTPTNPILHTSRTYELFGKYERYHEFEKKQKFYVGWTDAASEILFAMDEELHSLLDSMDGIDTKAIKRLSEHYESPTISDLTTKINGIPTFQSVYAPMKELNGKYIADTESRMFTEDFPWGLLVIRSYFDLFGIVAPTMDRLLKWYSNYMGLEWYKGDLLCGKDLYKTGAISNYGIKSRKALYSLYCGF